MKKKVVESEVRKNGMKGKKTRRRRRRKKLMKREVGRKERRPG